MKSSRVSIQDPGLIWLVLATVPLSHDQLRSTPSLFMCPMPGMKLNEKREWQSDWWASRWNLGTLNQINGMLVEQRFAGMASRHLKKFLNHWGGQHRHHPQQNMCIQARGEGSAAKNSANNSWDGSWHLCWECRHKAMLILWVQIPSLTVGWLMVLDMCNRE